jgi:hypothetical protein
LRFASTLYAYHKREKERYVKMFKLKKKKILGEIFIYSLTLIHGSPRILMDGPFLASQEICIEGGSTLLC